MSPQTGPEVKYRNFLIKEVRYVWGKGADVSTFAAQIRQESDWNHTARSKYAVGLTQFTGPTARWIVSVFPELKTETMAGGDVRFDWRWSIRAMVRYDAYLFNRIERLDVANSDKWPLTLRAYNGGISWVLKEVASCRTHNMECCLMFRSRRSCEENISYPADILLKWKPAYIGWNR
jgi:soluble lytic murein transglycosylase-like protein